MHTRIISCTDQFCSECLCLSVYSTFAKNTSSECPDEAYSPDSKRRPTSDAQTSAKFSTRCKSNIQGSVHQILFLFFPVLHCVQRRLLTRLERKRCPSMFPTEYYNLSTVLFFLVCGENYCQKLYEKASYLEQFKLLK